MNKILTFADRPSAVFARNDAFAIGAIRAVGEKGLGVPGDMAVIGFDNIRESEFSTPPLTTILCPKDVIASELVRAVMNRIEQKNSNLPYEEVIIEPELIVRKSCGIGEWAVTMRSLANGRGESGRKRQKSFQGNGFLHGGSKP